MKRGWIWPWIVMALLALGVGANVLLLVVAQRDPSFAVEEDYYAKALAWDESRAQARRNRDLGWSIRLTERPSRRGEGWAEIEADVRDASGRALDHARVEVQAFQLSRAREVVHAVLESGTQPTYVASFPIRRAGLWELRFKVVRGGQIFTETLRRDLGLAR